MRVMMKLLAAASIALFLASCASTETRGISDPDFVGKQYQKIVIYATVPDLKSRQDLENLVVTEMMKRGITAYMGTNLFPPTREWSEDEMQKAMVDKGFDGFLKIDLVNQDVKETVDNATSTTTTTGEQSKTRDGKTKYKETSTTTTNANVTKTFFSSFQTDLIDVKTNRKAWTATSNSQSGQGFSDDFSLIFESYAEDIVEHLKKHGHIKQ